jgi:thermolysin
MKRSLLLLGVIALSVVTAAQQLPSTRAVTVFTQKAADTAAWDARLMSWEAAGELQRLALKEDTVMRGWFHERFQQRYRGLRVFGAHVIRHWHNGRVESVNGKFYEGIGLDTTAAVGPGEAKLAAERSAGTGSRVVSEPELLIYPTPTAYLLAYRMHVRTETDLLLAFVDAANGSVVASWSDWRNQRAVVGRGTGTWEDVKKMSTTEDGATYKARDGLRPAVSYTVDVRGKFNAWNTYAIDPSRSAARDPDNDWRDGAVVDAHVYAGWVYDYYFKRFGRRGINDNNVPVTSYVHIWPRSWGLSPITNNAFWDPRDLSMNYGDGDGVQFNYFSSALDVVAHELSHGVTQFSSDLIYQNESGALDESFCDIMATGAEFFHEPAGIGRQRAEWAGGEDLIINNFGGVLRAFRYYPDPLRVGDPDHYSIRYRGSEDNGGVHINSPIVTHAFYLFVEGGQNRTSGARVGGIGMANIERAEKIFYRAFTQYLVPTSNFSDARQATLRSARDIYGAGSVEEQQLTQAWNAVGIY